MAGKRGAPMGNQNAKGGGRGIAKAMGVGGVVGGLTLGGIKGASSAIAAAKTVGVLHSAATYVGASVGAVTLPLHPVLGAVAGSVADNAVMGLVTKGMVSKAALGGAKVGGLHGAAVGAGIAAVGAGAYYGYKAYKGRKMGRHSGHK